MPFLIKELITPLIDFVGMLVFFDKSEAVTSEKPGSAYNLLINDNKTFFSFSVRFNSKLASTKSIIANTIISS